MSHHPARRAGPHPALLAAAGLAASFLSACASDRVVDNPLPPFDYHREHPIVLAQAQRSLDVYVVGGPGAIGARQIGDVRAFAAEYRRSGAGPLVIAMPQNNPKAYRSVSAVRQALAEAGVPSPQTSSYVSATGSPDAPIRLAFATLQAKVASQCGQWPTDLGGLGGTVDGWDNRPWENFGCSTQTALAAQVADPLDLARPRPDGAPSAARRGTVIAKYNKGEATATSTPDDGKEKINTSVGQ